MILFSVVAVRATQTESDRFKVGSQSGKDWNCLKAVPVWKRRACCITTTVSIPLDSQKCVLAQCTLASSPKYFRWNTPPPLASTPTWHSHTTAVVAAGVKFEYKFKKGDLEGNLNWSDSGIRVTLIGRCLSESKAHLWPTAGCQVLVSLWVTNWFGLVCVLQPKSFLSN